MAELSPATQAVLDTMHRSYDHESTRRALAAGVVRAAVDQVLPLYMCSLTSTRGTTRLGVRQKLLAIATELEGVNA